MKFLFLIIIIVVCIVAFLLTKVIGGAPKNAVILLLKDNSFLAVRGKDNRWMLPGGNIDPGETPRNAALREFHEEAEHKLKDVTWKKEIWYNKGELRNNDPSAHTIIYIINSNDDIPTQDLINNTETNRREWIPINEYDSQGKKWRQDAWNSLRFTLIPMLLKQILQNVDNTSDDTSEDSTEELVKLSRLQPPSESEDESEDTTPPRMYPPSESEDESEDTRPVCQYGTNCYRKNPQHFKEYQHP